MGNLLNQVPLVSPQGSWSHNVSSPNSLISMKKSTSKVLFWIRGWSTLPFPKLKQVSQILSQKLGVKLRDQSLISDWTYCLLPWCWRYNMPLERNLFIPNIIGTRSESTIFVYFSWLSTCRMSVKLWLFSWVITKLILADFAQFLGGSTEGHDFGVIYSATDVILPTLYY